MDNVTHTLVGAALARGGLARRTALGTVTLLLAANAPDIDGIAYLGGPGADLAFRRGWTHGVLALVVLPLVVAGVILLADRLLRRLRHAALPSGVRPREILLLAAIGVLSHPVLDLMNTYGVRLLMPFSGQWYYGDTLFIIDPWLWLILGTGLWLGRRRRLAREFRLDVTRPPRVALAVAALYVAAVGLLGLAARGAVRRELLATAPDSVGELMMAPVALNPFRRTVVAEQGRVYRLGTFDWLAQPHLDPATLRSFPRPRADDPALAAARTVRTGRWFLDWARFPSGRRVAAPGGDVIELLDLRYSRRPGGFGSFAVPLAGDPRDDTFPASLLAP